MTSSKKIAAAALATLISTATMAPAARADDADVSTWMGATSCADFASDKDPRWIGWIAGFWSGLNASGGPYTAGRVGHGMTPQELYTVVLAECLKNRKEDVQNALYSAYSTIMEKTPKS